MGLSCSESLTRPFPFPASEPEQFLQLYVDMQSLVSDQLFEGDELCLSGTNSSWELPAAGTVSITVSAGSVHPNGGPYRDRLRERSGESSTEEGEP